MSKILVVNRGSASEKYAIYTQEGCQTFLHLERSGKNSGYICTITIDGKKEVIDITKKEFQNSLKYSLDIFVETKTITSKEDIVGIGIRIVAPGKHFQDDKLIDKIYEKEIKRALPDAPLHLLPTFQALKELKRELKNVPIAGISDSDFHSTIPEKAKYYGLPMTETKKYSIERYGYHGISVESILHKIKKESKIPKKLIICHIGSGVSVTAVKDGLSIENSMGFSPLEGVMMATRAGNIDPGVVAFIGEKLNIKGDKLKNYLSKNCGLLGVSGASSDVRDLISLESEGNVQAKLALDMYAYSIQKQIGAYYVALGGLDTLIFTGTVGERSFIMRDRICEALGSLNIKIDPVINNKSEGVDVDLSAEESAVKVLVRTTDEMGQIARDTIVALGL